MSRGDVVRAVDAGNRRRVVCGGVRLPVRVLVVQHGRERRAVAIEHGDGCPARLRHHDPRRPHGLVLGGVRGVRRRPRRDFVQKRPEPREAGGILLRHRRRQLLVPCIAQMAASGGRKGDIGCAGFGLVLHPSVEAHQGPQRGTALPAVAGRRGRRRRYGRPPRLVVPFRAHVRPHGLQPWLVHHVRALGAPDGVARTCQDVHGLFTLVRAPVRCVSTWEGRSPRCPRPHTAR